MKEYKFRGYSKTLSQWLYGALVHLDDGYYIVSESDMERDGHHIRQTSDFPLWVEWETVGMYVGLRDKNGKEIYGGDIVKTQFHEKAFGEVRWHPKGYFCIDESFGKKDLQNVDCLSIGDFMNAIVDGQRVEIEIVGNKFESK